MIFERAKAPLGPAAAEAAQKLVPVAGELLGADRHTLFDAWSIADADLAFMLHRLVLNGDPVPQNLKQYAETQWKRASVRAYVEHERPRR